MTVEVANLYAGKLSPAYFFGKKEYYDELHDNPFLGGSYKVNKGVGHGVLTAILYMMPAMESGREACSGRSEGCTAACLAEGTGRMSMRRPREARRRRHAAFYADKARFLADLDAEIKRHHERATKQGLIAAVRLNGTTDLPWWNMRFAGFANLFSANPMVKFYDYTKKAISKKIPEDWHITYSVSEKPNSDQQAVEYLDAGHGAAVVMDCAKHHHPPTFDILGKTYPVVDGDLHDARFLDPPGVIVALAAKGRAKHDQSGFVRRV